jgi:hypothetical protein
MDRKDFNMLTRIHSGLPELEPAPDLTDRIMAGVEAARSGRTGWMWRVLVPAAAAVFVLLGIRIGTQIMDAWFEEPEIRHAEVTGLEYLEAYPPDSFGEVMDLASRGGEDE